VLRLPLLAVADAAATLLAEPGRASAVHACPGRGCGWLFLDPRGRRRWCSMAVCGNRAKARKHAARRDSGR
jgi:predicted RNA-binding Zn ribbon-like protein